MCSLKPPGYPRRATRRQTPSEQTGFVLPVFLVLLIVAGSTSVKQQTARWTDKPIYLHAAQQIRQLHRAKQQLIAYAVTYPDNYGPSGAGPGHLPCPDRDPPDDGNPNNDGPDPPCGSAAVQVGRVPRLTLAEKRFTTNSDNRFKLLEFFPPQSFVDRQPWYWVDDGFINNPVNRQVNMSTVTAKQNKRGSDVVAVLVAPGAERNESQQRPGLNLRDYAESLAPALSQGHPFSRDYDETTNDLQVFIYREDIMPLVEQRVNGFLLEQVATKFNALKQARAPGAACAEPLHEQDDVGTITCFDWLVDDGELEGVAAHRHWFFRNGWDQLTTVSVAALR